jgi:hypothetical protein
MSYVPREAKTSYNLEWREYTIRSQWMHAIVNRFIDLLEVITSYMLCIATGIKCAEKVT